MGVVVQVGPSTITVSEIGELCVAERTERTAAREISDPLGRGQIAEVHTDPQLKRSLVRHLDQVDHVGHLVGQRLFTQDVDAAGDRIADEGVMTSRWGGDDDRVQRDVLGHRRGVGPH